MAHRPGALEPTFQKKSSRHSPVVGPPRQSQLPSATEMSFDDFCSRARYFATVSKQAHFVTQLNGMYQVTAEPQYTDHILYTARPITPSDSKND
jgi:hypothetical protein